MNFFRDLFDQVQCLLHIIWEIILMILLVVSIPILFFCPLEVTQNFNKIVNRIALKILWVIWRVIKTSLLILLALIIFLLGPILWPVYLGILVLFPRFAAYIMSIKIF